MKRQNIRTLSLVVITLTYLIIGAAVFDHLESANELLENTLLNRNITMFKKKHNMDDESFNRLWHKILEKKPYHAGNQWKFIGSLYFCTVAVTLIGYGHSTPRTVSGKFFCIFYTLIGIPVFLIMFQSVGERLNSFIVFIVAKLKKRFKLKSHEVSLVELITIEGFFSMTITILASYIFMKNEDWSYFDSMYYCFITLTTIGFGDMVPMQKNNSLSKNFPYACFTILFILIGLTTLASSMNLLVLRLATINAEEQVQERLEKAEALNQQVHVEGDRIFVLNSSSQEKEQVENTETISVCSCACLDYKLGNQSSNKFCFQFTQTDKSSLSENSERPTNNKRFFSIFRKSGQVKRLIGRKVSTKIDSNTTKDSNHLEMKNCKSLTLINDRSSKIVSNNSKLLIQNVSADENVNIENSNLTVLDNLNGNGSHLIISCESSYIKRNSI